MSQNYKLTPGLTEEEFYLLKSFQRVALQILWIYPDGLSGGKVWSLTNMEMNQLISRANVLAFLSALVEKNILDYSWEPFEGGKQGYFWQKKDNSKITNLMENTINKVNNILVV